MCVCVCVCVRISEFTDVGLSHEATDILLLRHRRTMKQLLELDFSQFLNCLVKGLLQQAGWVCKAAISNGVVCVAQFYPEDLDEVFMRSARDGDMVLRAKNKSFMFQARLLLMLHDSLCFLGLLLPGRAPSHL